MPTVHVLRKVKVEGAWKLLPVQKVGDKYDFAHVVHAGVPVVATSGTFYLEWREGGQRKRNAVGTHPRDAKVALQSQTQVVKLRSQGIQADDVPQIAERRQLTGPTIQKAIDDFKAAAPLKYAVKSQAKYMNALKEFAAWAPSARRKTHLSQLDRTDVLEFMGHLVSQVGLDTSTAVDKGHIVHAALNQHGAQIRMQRKDWPRLTETEVTVYEPAELDKLFAAATPYEFTLFQTYRLTGFREQAIAFLTWDDFNPRRRTMSVTEKRALGFRPKDREERTIPIPDVLVELLQKHRKTQEAGTQLIFPTSSHLAHQGRPGGQRDRHMLDRLKKLAMRAGLNCGHCQATLNKKPVTCADRPVCKKWGLHKFRHSYATTMLRDGLDLASLQVILGHQDLESTKRYLRALEPDALRAKLDRSSLSASLAPRYA